MENVNDTSLALLNPIAGHDPVNEPESRIAADRLAAEIAAVPESETIHVTVDVGAGVTLALGVWPALVPHLPEIAKLPGIDIERVCKLRDYTLALHYWQSNTIFATKSPAALATMVDKGIEIRDRTMKALTSLASFGVIDAASLAGFAGTTAHRKVAQDLTGLSSFVHGRWEAIRGKSMLTLEAMDEAARLGDAILQSIGDRDRTQTPQTQATLQRDKAYTLFVRAYDEARRAMIYLRWHEGDADAILPSVYTVRRTAKKRAGEETESSVVPEAPAAAAPAQQSSLIVPSTSGAPAVSASPFIRE